MSGMDRSIEEIQADRVVDLLADKKQHLRKITEKNRRIEELEGLLGDLYDEVSYECAGEWVIDNKDLQRRVKQALEEEKEDEDGCGSCPSL